MHSDRNSSEQFLKDFFLKNTNNDVLIWQHTLCAEAKNNCIDSSWLPFWNKKQQPVVCSFSEVSGKSFRDEEHIMHQDAAAHS